MSFSVHGSPLEGQQAEWFARLLESMTPEQAAWVAGYLAGLQAGRGAAGSSTPGVAAGGSAVQAAGGLAPAAGAQGPEVTILYGSQTGNAMRLARQTAKRLAARGFAATPVCMSEFRPKDLKKVQRLLIVASTHGEGDPPDKARPFHEFLHGRRAPKLDGVQYSVLALGDLTYKQYCKTGRDFDERLAELGAERLHERVDCDVDFDEPAENWMEGVLAALCRRAESSGATMGPLLPVSSNGDGAKPAVEYTRSRPYHAEVLENLNLNGRGSDKETRQLKLSLEGSGLAFEPGDSLGVYPQNRLELVDALIAEMGWNADEPVKAGKEEHPLRDALLKHFEITALTRPLLEQAARFSRDGLADMVARADDAEIDAYLHGRDLLDLVRDYALRGAPAKDFTAALRRMPARLYSIASSRQANPDEVDLIVVALRYHAHGRDRFGTCSTHIAERLGEGDRVPIYVHENPNFRMPPDDAPMIMVGPGTGVAPFRAFLEQREETGATGKNWLFFGDRRFRTDFLCQTEWLRWVKTGLLARMDVAFSRDTAEKVYVQHRMMEHARDIHAWLQEGAYFYVCGDEKRMAPDVHAALETIVEREGGMTGEQAKAFLAELQRQNRYQRDVY